MQEVWRPVVGWEGLYEVSDQGQVRSVARTHGRRAYGGKIMAQIKRGRYLAVKLRDVSTGRERLANTHTLVAAAFIGPRPEGQVVRHGAKGPHDNSTSNLSYGTHRENCHDRKRDGTWAIADTAARRILTSDQAKEIYQSTEPSPALASRYGVDQTTIRKIWAGKNWSSVTRLLPARPQVA